MDSRVSKIQTQSASEKPFKSEGRANDVVSCKDVPFGGSQNNILHLTAFAPKQILAIFDLTSHQKGLNKVGCSHVNYP